MDLDSLPITHAQLVHVLLVGPRGYLDAASLLQLFDPATARLFELVKLDTEAMLRFSRGLVPREQHLRYSAEIRDGERVVVRSRILDWSERRVHVLHLMGNASTGVLAATLELVGVCVDSETRRPVPWPTPVVTELERLRSAHELAPQLSPLCGVLAA